MGSKTRGNCTRFPGGGQGGWQEPAEEMAVGRQVGKASDSLAQIAVARSWHRNHHTRQGLTTGANAFVGTSGQGRDEGRYQYHYDYQESDAVHALHPTQFLGTT